MKPILPIILLCTAYTNTLCAQHKGDRFMAKDGIAIDNVTALIDNRKQWYSLSDNTPKNYPNPAADITHIDFENETESDFSLIVTNLLGQTIAAEQRRLAAGSYTATIEGLPQGTFVVCLKTPQGKHSLKLVAQGTDSNRACSAKTSITKRGEATSNNNKTQNTLYEATAGDQHTRAKTTPNGIVVFDFAPCVDADGNRYTTVSIGGQLWMAEDLRTTRFSNGDPIPVITKNRAWCRTNQAARCAYGNDTDAAQGTLYNGHAATDPRSICPQGWAVPTDDDWDALQDALGDANNTGTTLTAQPGDINESQAIGFDAQKNGLRYAHGGKFGHHGEHARWWTSTTGPDGNQWNRYVNDGKEFLGRGAYSPRYGYSVRCIKK